METSNCISSLHRMKDGLKEQNIGKSGNRKLTMSYDHPVDERYPLVTLTLPELYQLRSNCTLGTGVTWHSYGVKLTYQQLYAKGKELAKGLLALGLQRGDVILSVGVDGPKSILMFIAASFTGIIFAAPYVYSPLAANISIFLKMFKPKLMTLGNALTGAELEDPYPAAIESLQMLLKENADDPLPALFREKGSTHKTLPGTCDARLKNIEYIEELSALGETISDEKLEEMMSQVTPNEPCFYTQSSGSTGAPKTIVVGAALLVNGGSRRMHGWKLNTSSRVGSTSMCSEDLGHIEEVLSGFYIGHEVLAIPSPKSWDCRIACADILVSVEQHRTEMLYTDQYFMNYFVNYPNILKKYDISCLKVLLFGGSGISPQFKQSAINLFPESLDSYGLSECYYATCSEPGSLKRNLQTVGKSNLNQEMKVVDVKGAIVPCQTRGELLIRGYGLFLEYKDEPELTNQVMTSDGWFKTGDCATMDSDGQIQIIGRMSTSERFKICSDVVYAQPIEKIMKICPEIEDIVVVGRPTGTPVGDELSYCVKLYEDNSMTPEMIRDFAHANIVNSREWPVRVFIYDKFPRHGARNKVSRRALVKEIANKVAGDFEQNLVDRAYIQKSVESF